MFFSSYLGPLGVSALASFVSEHSHASIFSRNDDVRLCVAIYVSEDRRAERDAGFDFPQNAGFSTVIRNRIERAVAGGEYEFGIAVAVDVAACDVGAGCLHIQVPAKRSVGDVVTRELPVLPGEAH